VTIVSLVTPLTAEIRRNLWVVATVVLRISSIGLGYSQRPKTEARAYQPTVPQTQPAATMETPAMTEALELTQVKGIGEKRAPQLKAIGISSVSDLAKASAEDIAKKLRISSKITKKWIASAKALVK
jgi:predicted flap endonuclease-1-like 5' DNA nuclease